MVVWLRKLPHLMLRILNTKVRWVMVQGEEGARERVVMRTRRGEHLLANNATPHSSFRLSILLSQASRGTLEPKSGVLPLAIRGRISIWGISLMRRRQPRFTTKDGGNSRVRRRLGATSTPMAGKEGRKMGGGSR